MRERGEPNWAPEGGVRVALGSGGGGGREGGREAREGGREAREGGREGGREGTEGGRERRGRKGGM